MTQGEEKETVSEDWFDFVGIHDDVVILFGRRADGTEFHRELTEPEREKIYALTRKHDLQREALLRELAA